jgi:hypothetical protein
MAMVELTELNLWGLAHRTLYAFAEGRISDPKLAWDEYLKAAQNLWREDHPDFDPEKYTNR